MANPTLLIDWLGLDAIWPTTIPRVTDSYDPRPSLLRDGRPHDAVDAANDIGDLVYASDSGVVSDVSTGAAGANQIKISNDEGSTSGYAHVAPLVEPGQSVSAGQVIGTTDLSGRATGPHLHYTFRPCPGCPKIDPLPHLAYGSARCNRPQPSPTPESDLSRALLGTGPPGQSRAPAGTRAETQFP